MGLQQEKSNAVAFDAVTCVKIDNNLFFLVPITAEQYGYAVRFRSPGKCKNNKRHLRGRAVTALSLHGSALECVHCGFHNAALRFS